MECNSYNSKNLLNELNASSQVHAEVNELPNNALLLVLLLFQNKHGVVEKLLQFLISEVDAQLLHAVVLEKGTGPFIAAECNSICHKER